MKAAQVFATIHELGLPIDGSIPELHARMRPGLGSAERKLQAGIQNWHSVLRVLKLVKSGWPEVEVTIRTVVNRLNVEDVPRIGMLLAGLECRADRWKLYQHFPVGVGGSKRSDLSISDHTFRQVVQAAMKAADGIQVVAQGADDGDGRYLFLGSDGLFFNAQHQVVGHWREVVTESMKLDVAAEPQRNGLHAVPVLIRFRKQG